MALPPGLNKTRRLLRIKLNSSRVFPFGKRAVSKPHLAGQSPGRCSMKSLAQPSLSDKVLRLYYVCFRIQKLTVRSIPSLPSLTGIPMSYLLGAIISDYHWLRYANAYHNQRHSNVSLQQTSFAKSIFAKVEYYFSRYRQKSDFCKSPTNFSQQYRYLEGVWHGAEWDHGWGGHSGQGGRHILTDRLAVWGDCQNGSWGW